GFLCGSITFLNVLTFDNINRLLDDVFLCGPNSLEYLNDVPVRLLYLRGQSIANHFAIGRYAILTANVECLAPLSHHRLRESRAFVQPVRVDMRYVHHLASSIPIYSFQYLQQFQCRAPAADGHRLVVW